MLIKKVMMEKIISGAHKCTEGKVLFSYPKTERIFVEGVNLIN